MPIPILALMSLVGLFVYVVIGAAVSAVHLKKGCGWRLRDGVWDRKTEHGSYAQMDWTGAIGGALFWPVLVAAYSVGAAAYVLGVGPVWIGRRVLIYTFSALEKGD